jgi:hypothetical protein
MDRAKIWNSLLNRIPFLEDTTKYRGKMSARPWTIDCAFTIHRHGTSPLQVATCAALVLTLATAYSQGADVTGKGGVLNPPSMDGDAAIRSKYELLGGAAGFLGRSVDGIRETATGIGRYQSFRGGVIYWHPATGAREVHGAILEKWTVIGREAGLLGYPTSDETATSDGSGRFSHFQSGSIYWHPETGAHEIHGAILSKWAALGWERGLLGYPTTDEAATPDGTGRYNHFKGGSIYWHPETGAHEVHGAIRERWAALGWETGFLGYPVTDEQELVGGQGRVSRFQRGQLEWSSASGQVTENRNALRRFRITFRNIAPHNSHDIEGCGHWDMLGAVNGKPIELMRSTCVFGEGRYAFDGSVVNHNGANLRQLGPPLGPRFVEVVVPSNGFILIETSGRERDKTEDHEPSPLTGLVSEFYPKLSEYLKSKYGKELSETEKDLAVYKEIADGLASQFAANNSTWEGVLAGLGQTGGTALSIYAVFGTQAVPVWGQVLAAGVAVYELVTFLSNLNNDDGIGEVHTKLDESNNWGLGARDYRSIGNGTDDDSAGDYDLNIQVEELAAPVSVAFVDVIQKGARAKVGPVSR